MSENKKKYLEQNLIENPFKFLTTVMLFMISSNALFGVLEPDSIFAYLVFPLMLFFIYKTNKIAFYNITVIMGNIYNMIYGGSTGPVYKNIGALLLSLACIVIFLFHTIVKAMIV